ncbi:hypothetical protein MXB_3680 [Myxobolus squamalis]|nr:hypothetical protein MXB_3680 [Myxobolus squamalis]
MYNIYHLKIAISELVLKRNQLFQESCTTIENHYKNILSDPVEFISDIDEFFKIYQQPKQLPSIKIKILNTLTDIFIDLAPG